MEQRPGPGLAGYNYSHYPELDHAPAFAWSGQQETESRTHNVSSDGESVQSRQLSDEGDEFSLSEDHGSMTRWSSPILEPPITYTDLTQRRCRAIR
jgi:hypothetical protein